MEEENTFHKEMINSPDLYDYIRENRAQYSCFVFIPYMFGTTYWGVQACPGQAVLIPCFHDESYAHMKTFRTVYSEVAGMLFNAQPEQDLTEHLCDTSRMKTEVMGLGMDTKLTYDADRFRKNTILTTRLFCMRDVKIRVKISTHWYSILSATNRMSRIA